ncbi:MAG: hypothetical protein H6907_11935 [Hyphomicrobiales bacterium]|nr:hypothetical protein [Hyphomicrobiales bacterium]MCP5372432.1 hypothetical protein [Hyphomicrobiales bacterium]
MGNKLRESGVRFKTRETILTPSDGDLLSKFLIRAFPNIRFHRREYYEYTLNDLDYDLVLRDIHHVRADPSNLEIPYVESMGVRNGSHFVVWIEPPGWEPLWLGPNEWGIHSIVNKPELSFAINTSYARDARSRSNEGAKKLEIQRAEANYFPDQLEKKRFLDKVWRILAKLTTNQLLRVDRVTREPLSPEPRSQYCWAGPDAIRWALEHPLRTFGEDLRPAGPLDVPELD